MGDVLAFPIRPLPDRGPAPEPEREPLWREAVGRELREARRTADRTLADVAKEAGVSTQYLSEIERGLKEPSSEVLGAVAGALGLRLMDLTSRVTHSIGTLSIPTSGPTGPVCLAI